MTTIGEELRRARQERGLSLRETAARSSLSAAGIWKVEHDKASPTASSMVALSRALGVFFLIDEKGVELHR